VFTLVLEGGDFIVKLCTDRVFEDGIVCRGNHGDGSNDTANECVVKNIFLNS
jgi:hypothetical protein